MLGATGSTAPKGIVEGDSRSPPAAVDDDEAFPTEGSPQSATFADSIDVSLVFFAVVALLGANDEVEDASAPAATPLLPEVREVL
ncbi:hypothetical protein GUJ93_ZPchr0005g14236 [Zizania palustris]|uniref:Uncharacterized protein n=1 Tax=Zizania palustris TaxID=103762 RepID=A0A8J5VI66_ZIZPA|nr:hypothetical protein GUJ93_ZPchr0005g14236 [Zizania palustris]